MGEKAILKEKIRTELERLQRQFLSSIKHIDAQKFKLLEEELFVVMQGISLKNEKKAKRSAELVIANLELKFLNEEMAKRAAELDIANNELLFQNEEKAKRAAELAVANIELVFQNKEKSKRAAELIIANRELVFQNKEKAKRAAELIIANRELVFQNKEKVKRAGELIIANKELIYQNGEKEKRAVELVQAKEKAEHSDLLKSAFLANMSHEIRTPMNGILGFADLLREPELSGEMQQEYIGIIKKSGSRMLNIINDIVSFSKIEAGLVELNLKKININKQMDFIHIFFNPQMEKKGLCFLVKKPLPLKEAFIKSDSEKIYSILTNLVKNAIKYTKKGTIELGYILKRENKYQEVLEFYVRDTGIGIPLERRKAIFERFVQADISDKMARQGAGLGLSISKAYVEMLGGKMWVESENKKGSTFYFNIPYRILPVGKNADTTIILSKKAENRLDLKILKLKILIAEDDKISALLISTLVKKYSTEILHAKTGIEAVTICRNNPDIDLILMDIQMPKLNGDGATKLIREFNQKAVIIAQTASVLSSDTESIGEMGYNDIIFKPINKAKLLGLIKKHFPPYSPV